MNTFGALKYLEAEQTVVEEIMLNLKDQLNKLKIEELAIRASIRSRMKASQANAVDLDSLGRPNQSFSGGGPSTLPNAASYQMNVLPSSSSSGMGFDASEATVQARKQNRPIEVSINEALEMISRYRERDFLSHPGDDAMDPHDEDAAEFEDAELEEVGMDEVTEFDEPTSSTMNPGVEFLDLRHAEPEDDDPS